MIIEGDIGSVIRGHIIDADDGSTVNVSAATENLLIFQSPGGTISTALAVDTIDGSYIQSTLQTAFFDSGGPGGWQVQTKSTFSATQVTYGRPKRFEVGPKLA